jgi:hypothetical protein
MMSQNKNLSELLEVVETLRLSEFDDIPKDLIEKILINEFENQDNRQECLKKTSKLINDYLSKVESGVE